MSHSNTSARVLFSLMIQLKKQNCTKLPWTYKFHILQFEAVGSYKHYRQTLLVAQKPLHQRPNVRLFCVMRLITRRVNCSWNVFTALCLFVNDAASCIDTRPAQYTKASDTLESFLLKVTFERNLAHVSWKLSQFFFFRNKLSPLEHVLFVKVSFASYFRKRFSKENFLVCHYHKNPCKWTLLKHNWHRPVVKVAFNRWWSSVYVASVEHESTVEVWGQRTWSGDHGAKPPEAGGILISAAKNKTKIKTMNSNKVQLERIGAGAKQRLNRRWQRWTPPYFHHWHWQITRATYRKHEQRNRQRARPCSAAFCIIQLQMNWMNSTHPTAHRETIPQSYHGKSNLLPLIQHEFPATTFRCPCSVHINPYHSHVSYSALTLLADWQRASCLYRIYS